MSNQVIIDSGDLRKYRIELPNLIDDEMDPFQARLYMHYKRVCGGGGSGECWESVRTTATKCKMSTDKVINTRQWLADNNWIHLQQDDKGVYHINIIDRWLDNFTRYAKGGVLNIEQPVRYIEREVFDISNKRKNNSKKEHKEEVEADACNGSASPTPSPTPRKTKKVASPESTALMEAYIELIKANEPGAVINYQREREGINRLAAAGCTPDRLVAAYRTLKVDKFWQGKHISSQSLGTQIGAILARVEDKQVSMELTLPYEW